MMTQDARQKLIQLLKDEEGYKQFPYHDTIGHLTIGYGHNLDSNGLSKQASLFVLNEDIDYFLEKTFDKIKYFVNLSDTRKVAIISMVFNFGVHGFMQLTDLHLALESENWQKAHDEILSYKAARQNPNRYKRIAQMILTDEYITGDVYGTA